MSTKFLLIRFSSLGDCVLLCPLAGHLKQSGAAEVAVLTKSAYAPLFEMASGVDRVIAYDPSTGIRGLVGLARRLRGDGYHVLDAHNNWRSRIATGQLGGAQARFQKHYAARLALITVKKPARLPSIPEGYARLTTGPWRPTSPLPPGRIRAPETAVQRARRALSGSGPFVAVAPGSRWESKRWPAAHFADLTDRLVNTGGCVPVLVGDAQDRAHAGAAYHPDCVDTMGRCGLPETAALLARCRLLIGNDSGLMHLAEAVDTPVVALFGPTVDAFGYYPSHPDSVAIERTLGCRPCSRNGSVPCIRGTRECLTGIDVDVVADVAANVLANQCTDRRVLLG